MPALAHTLTNPPASSHTHPKLPAPCGVPPTPQLGAINTNSRYLHPTLTTYSKLLVGTMPLPLEVRMFFVGMLSSGTQILRATC